MRKPSERFEERYAPMVACVLAGKPLSGKLKDIFNEFRKEFENSGDEAKVNFITQGTELLK